VADDLNKRLTELKIPPKQIPTIVEQMGDVQTLKRFVDSQGRDEARALQELVHFVSRGRHMMRYRDALAVVEMAHGR
jgi:hypothetical protein